MEWYHILLIIVASIGAVFMFLILPGNKKNCLDSTWLYKTYIAHRGLFDNEKGIIENSHSAFKKAIEKGFIIETDLHLTKDHYVVVFHDDDFKRLCGVDKKIAELTLKEIKQLSYENSQDKVMEFSEFLTLIDGNVGLLLEFKHQNKVNDRILCEKAIELLKNYKGKYAIQSFYPNFLAWFKKHYPTIVRGQLCTVINLKEEYRNTKGSKFKKIISVVSKWLYNNKLSNFIGRPLFISHNYKDINTMARFTHLFIPMIIYTVDNKEAYNQFKNKVDNIIFENLNM